MIKGSNCNDMNMSIMISRTSNLIPLLFNVDSALNDNMLSVETYKNNLIQYCKTNMKKYFIMSCRRRAFLDLLLSATLRVEYLKSKDI